MLKNYLIEMFGKDNVEQLHNENVVLPLYLREYNYSIYSIYNTKYVFVESKNDINLKTYKAQIKEIEKHFNCYAVIVVKKINTDKRENLIKNRIMFVETNRQLFMPISGISLINYKNVNEIAMSQNLTPQMQLVALYFVYNNNFEVTVKDIEKTVCLNSMAISRALAFLEYVNLVSSENIGRKKIYSLSVDKKEFIKKFISLSCYPISKIILINKKEIIKEKYISGYKALSKYSMINGNDEIYAISKEEYNKIKDKSIIYNESMIYNENFIQFEVWKYDPKIFAQNGYVDPLSLILTFNKDNIDERTEDIFDEILRSIENE